MAKDPYDIDFSKVFEQESQRSIFDSLADSLSSVNNLNSIFTQQKNSRINSIGSQMDALVGTLDTVRSEDQMNRLVENFNAIAPNASSYVETNIKLNEVYNKIQNKQSDFDSYNTSMDRIKSHMAGPNVIDSMEEYRNLAGAEGEWRGYHDMGWNAQTKKESKITQILCHI